MRLKPSRKHPRPAKEAKLSEINLRRVERRVNVFFMGHGIEPGKKKRGNGQDSD
jgi:hypothetical protein